jgi:GNAT superfamily N-acetyltransferase
MAPTEDTALPLRDGRTVTLSAPAAADSGAVAALLEAVADPRGELFGRVAAALAAGEPGGALVARETSAAPLAAYGAWLVEEPGARGELVCAVAPPFTGQGLGTLLLRTLERDARAAGLLTLRVELHPDARALAAMLRDCGLHSFWDLEHPVAHVELVLGSRRPGWVTP